MDYPFLSAMQNDLDAFEEIVLEKHKVLSDADFMAWYLDNNDIVKKYITDLDFLKGYDLNAHHEGVKILVNFKKKFLL